MHTLTDVKVDESKLLQKGYSTKDLVGHKIVVTGFRMTEGDMGLYLSCDITGEGLEEGKPFNTGAKNIVERLLACKEQGKLPVEVTVVKLSGNAFDII